MKQITSLFLVASTLASVASGDEQANWPCWRGPLNNGSTTSGIYPVKWTADSNLVWKISLPGKGCSTPIVWNQQIFLTAPFEKNDAALAFSWDGKLLWKTVFGTERAGKHQNGSGCNPSPATDGQSIFVHFKSGTLAALDLKGNIRWKINLIEKYGNDTLWWDYGSSVVLTEKDAIVAVMQEGGASYLAAFDKLTGEVHWKVPRNFVTALEGDHSYTTPTVIRYQDKEQLLVLGGEHLTAHDAATGMTLWSCGDFNTNAVKNWTTVASPVIVNGIAVVPYARGEQLLGIKLGGSGDVTGTHKAWRRMDTGSFVPTPAEYKGLVYVLRDKGGIDCVEPATGKILWKGNLPKDSSNYYASPSVADGKLYAIREDGVVSVAKIEGGFELLCQNDMGERMIASPVPILNRLLLRGEKHLFCVEVK